MGKPKTWNSEHLFRAKVFPCLSVRFAVCKTRMSLSKGYDKRWIFVCGRCLRINLLWFLFIKSFFVYRTVSNPIVCIASKIRRHFNIPKWNCTACLAWLMLLAIAVAVALHQLFVFNSTTFADNVINLNECALITCYNANNRNSWYGPNLNFMWNILSR